MRYKLSKKNRLKKNKEFQYVYQRGRSYANHIMVLYVLPRREDKIKVGFAAGKRLGNAVTRNRVKRLLREAYRFNQHEIKNGIDLLLVGRKPMTQVKFSSVLKAFGTLCTRAKIIKQCGGGS